VNRPFALAVVIVALSCAARDGSERRATVAGPAPTTPSIPVSPAPSPPASAITVVAALPSEPVDAGPPPSKCREQEPQPFLVRGNHVVAPKATAAERAQARAALQDANRYRTTHYGYFPGFGSPSDNSYPPKHYAVWTTFFGIRVFVNERIVPALACVETDLLRECASTGYKPLKVTGLRERNTYHDFEVSNHVYGIAVDIDSDKNPCCGCVKPWSDSPLCARHADSIFDRMVMPECWVHVFERYGFYWLGHDVLGDSMHFEFLGDPDHIDAAAAEASVSPAPGSSR
jgi:hypothetical protein